MRNKERIMLISFLVISLAVSLYVVLQFQSKLSHLEQKSKNLINDNANQKKLNVDNVTSVVYLKGEIQKRDEIINTQHNFDEATMVALKDKGFTGQLKDIVSDLKTHTELIPYKGILGGTMGFYGDNDIHVLTNRWVFAYFEDGHSSGYMLLKYDINNASITWKVIDSYLFP